MQRRLINFGDVAQQRIGEIASKHRADLRHLTRRPKPIEARSKGLLQGRRDGLNTALLAAFNKQARDFLYEQRHAAGPLAHAFDHLLGERMARRNFAHHARDAGAIKGAERDARCDANAGSRAGETQDGS